MAEGRFAGEVAMITGAGGGFGAAVAKRFAAEGAALLLSDINKSALDNLVEQLPAAVNVCAEAIDVTDENAVFSHIERGDKTLGPLTIAINNAGIGQVLTPLQDTATGEFDRIMTVNARSVFLGMKYQLAGMVPRKTGVILNVASAAGLVGAGQIAAYAASKHAVIGLTRSAADEVARYGIRVNAICPSFAPTELFHEIADDMAARLGTDRDGAYVRITSRVPMRRVAEIDEVVQAMLWRWTRKTRS